MNSWDDNVYCFKPDGTVKWKTLLGNDPQGLGIADIDNDGKLEIIVDSNDGLLNCLNSNGTIRWQTFVGQYAYDNNHPILDIDKDGELEIITGGGYDNVVRCLRT